MHQLHTRLIRMASEPRVLVGAPVLSGVMLALLVLLAVRAQVGMVNYGFWQDEIETMVASKMMASGLALYRNVFDQHGPLVFAVGWALESTSNASIAGYRILIAALQWWLVAVMVLTRSRDRSPPNLLSLALVLFWIVCVLPRVFGQMFMYQTLAGLFTAAAISLSVLPALQGCRTAAYRTLVAGVLLGSLPFLAFTYTAAALGLLVCAADRDTWRQLALGVALAVAGNLAILLTLGSVAGFMVDHLYLNVVIYPAFGKNSLSDIWGTVSPTSLLCLASALLIVLVSTYRLIRDHQLALWRGAAFSLGLISFLSRGPHFQAIPFYYAVLPLIMALASSLVPQGPSARLAATGLAILCAVKISLMLPSDIRRIKAGQIPTHSVFSDLVLRYTQPADRIISYSFDNLEYILSRRLPAAADFFLLPQQATYNAHPVLGVNYDPCNQIIDSKPKFVKLDKWTAWDKFPWASYGACVDDVMQKDYTQIKGTQIFVRSDLWPMLTEQGVVSPDGLVLGR